MVVDGSDVGRLRGVEWSVVKRGRDMALVGHELTDWSIHTVNDPHAYLA